MDQEKGQRKEAVQVECCASLPHAAGVEALRQCRYYFRDSYLGDFDGEARYDHLDETDRRVATLSQV
jgi:hypothetical protein